MGRVDGGSFLWHAHIDVTEMRAPEYMAWKSIVKLLRAKIKSGDATYPRAQEIVQELEGKLSEHDKYWRKRNVALTTHEKTVMSNIKSLWLKKSRTEKTHNISVFFPKNID